MLSFPVRSYPGLTTQFDVFEYPLYIPKDIHKLHTQLLCSAYSTHCGAISTPLGWQSLQSQIYNLPGPIFEDFQTQLVGIGGRHSSTANDVLYWMFHMWYLYLLQAAGGNVEIIHLLPKLLISTFKQFDRMNEQKNRSWTFHFSSFLKTALHL